MTGFNSANMTSQEHFIFLTPYDIVNMIIFVAIMIIGVGGNGLIIYMFAWKKRKSIQRFEGFLLMLGVVDLMASFFIPLLFMYLTVTNFQQWHFGKAGCKVIPSLLQISVTLSQGVLIIISYERYDTLVKPFDPRTSKWVIGLWMFFVFAISIGFVLPYMSTFRFAENSKTSNKFCAPDPNKIHLWITSASLQVFRDIIAATIMGYLNHKTNNALTKKHDCVTWDRAGMSKNGRRLLKMLIIVFSVLTLPVDVYQLVVYSVYLSNIHVTKTVINAITITNTSLNILQASNSVVNIFVYSRMHWMFRVGCCLPNKKYANKGRIMLHSPTEIELLTKGSLNMEHKAEYRQTLSKK